MRELARRQKVKRFLYSTPALIALLILSGFIVKGVLGAVLRERESAALVKSLENRMESLSSRKEELEKEIELLETSVGLEKEIKEKFNVTGEGENLVVIVDPKNESFSPDIESDTWLKRWWNTVKNLIPK